MNNCYSRIFAGRKRAAARAPDIDVATAEFSRDPTIVKVRKIVTEIYERRKRKSDARFLREPRRTGAIVRANNGNRKRPSDGDVSPRE